MVTDTRKQRAMLIVGLSAAIGAVLGDHFIRPMVQSLVKGGRR